LRIVDSWFAIGCGFFWILPEPQAAHGNQLRGLEKTAGAGFFRNNKHLNIAVALFMVQVKEG
jgi:hypothetical protein